MDPAAILQAYLDEVSAAVLRDDWATYRAGICLPCAVISHSESKIVATEAELRAGFVAFRDTLRAQRVTDYIRLVDRATMLDAELVAGSYMSHLISGGHRIVAPFQSLMTLRRVGGRWCAASVTNGLANSRWPLVRGELTSDGEGAAR